MLANRCWLSLLVLSTICAGTYADKSSNAAPRRVLIVGVDGLRPDALKAAKTPHFDRLISEGAFSDQALTGRVTKSAPGWASMLTGVWSDKHGVTSNDYSSTWRGLAQYPALVTRLESLCPERVSVSLANWSGIDLFLHPRADFKVRRETERLTDDEVAWRAVELLRTKSPEVVFLHFDDVDAAGHKHGFDPASAEYRSAIEVVDARVGKIVKAVDERSKRHHEDWLILSSSDHGGKGKSHGSAAPECRTVYFLAHGPGVRRGKLEPPPKVVDVAVTALVYLGIDPHPAWKLDGQAVGLQDEVIARATMPKVTSVQSSPPTESARKTFEGSGALSDFRYRGPTIDPHDGWTTPSSRERTEWSYAEGQDGAPGRLNVHGRANRENWAKTKQPAFTGDLTRYGDTGLRVSAFYWDTSPGKNLHDVKLQLITNNRGPQPATRWTLAAPGSIDCVYVPGRKSWTHVMFPDIDPNWTDAEAKRAGWHYEDEGHIHSPFSQAIRNVDVFGLCTNGSDDQWDVAYFDDIRLEPVQEPARLPKSVPPVGVPKQSPITRGERSIALHGGVVINVRDQKQLFLDDRFLVESSHGIRRVLNQPIKDERNPILVPERPWEHGGITGGTILHQGGLFRMWYRPHYGQHEVPGNGQILRTAYATSKDGITWERPLVGLIEYQGSKKNNLVLGNKAAGYGIHSSRVVHTPWDRDPQQQYKMLLTFVRHKPPRWGFGTAFSPDGIRWTAHPEPVKVDYHKHYGSFNTVFFDTLSERYVAYYQRRPQQKFPQPFSPSQKRYMGRMESKDFVNWTDPNYLAHGPDQTDPVGMDLFEPSPFQYSEASYVYLNAAAWYDEFTDQTWVRLGSSRDNLIWQWVGERRPFIPNGHQGTWDSMMIHPIFVPPVIYQDEVYFYYTAKTTKERPYRGIGKNDGALAKAGHPGGYEDFCLFSVGLAKLRLDGFVSLVAGVGTGSFTTRPIQFSGSKLELNVNAATTIGATREPTEITPDLDYGVRVEILDERGRVIPGFALEDCDPIREDNVRYPVTWKGSSDVGQLADKPIKLRFYLRFAKVYAFQFKS